MKTVKINGVLYLESVAKKKGLIKKSKPKAKTSEKKEK